MKRLKLILALLCMIFFYNESSYAQDWPNLERFKEQNKTVDTTVSDNVVFMGNSITQGWSDKNPEFFSQNHYINRGISGQTTPQMLIRFRPDVIDLKPAAVVILAGTNDIAGNTGPSTLKMIADNIKSMAELAKAHNIKVIISSVLPAFDYPWKPGLEPADKIIELNGMLKEYALANDMIYLDYFKSMVDDKKGLPKELSDDGVHPTLEGYKVMEPLVKEAIAEALSEK